MNLSYSDLYNAEHIINGTIQHNSQIKHYSMLQLREYMGRMSHLF